MRGLFFILFQIRADEMTNKTIIGDRKSSNWGGSCILNSFDDWVV